MKRNKILAICLGLILGSVACAARGERALEAPDQRFSIEQARAIALEKVPGEIRHEELEKEHGVWIYSFEIKPEGETANIVKEVNVRASSGEIVGIESEKDRTRS